MQNGQSFLDVSFSYVADPKLRGIIELFHSEAVAAFRQERYIATVILSGGVLEGILTFGLTRRESDARDQYRGLVETGKIRRASNRIPPIREWGLEELSEVAVGLKLIGETASKAASSVRDFRNFIHPSRLYRRSAPRWDALAAIAMGAVASISESLSGRIET